MDGYNRRKSVRSDGLLGELINRREVRGAQISQTTVKMMLLRLLTENQWPLSYEYKNCREEIQTIIGRNLENWEWSFYFHLMKDKIENLQGPKTKHHSNVVNTIRAGVHAARKVGVRLDFGDVLRLCVRNQLGPKAILSQGYALKQLCKMYKNDDLPELLSVLLDNGMNVSYCRGSLCDRNVIMALSENHPNYRHSIYESVKILIRKGIPVNCFLEQVNGRDNALLSFLRNVVRTSLYGCCLYGCLNNFMFFDTLELLIDSGIDVNQIDHDGSNALKYTLTLLRRASDEGPCPPCVRLNNKTGSKDYYMVRGLQFINHLLASGAKIEVPVRLISKKSLGMFVSEYFHFTFALFTWLFIMFWLILRNFWPKLHNCSLIDACRRPKFNTAHCKKWVLESAHLYVLENFIEDEIIAILEVFCRHGVNLNEKRLLNRLSINALDILCEANGSQIQCVERVLGFMRQHGYQY